MDLKELLKDKKERKEQIKELNQKIRIIRNNKNLKSSQVNELIRVSKKFNEELENIQKKRIDIGLDEKETSKPKLTDLIVKHKSWSNIKEDMVKFNFFTTNNKRGQMSIFIFIMFFALLAFAIFALVGGIALVKVNTALSQDVDIGNVNLKNITSDTFGKYTTMYLNNADWWGICTIAGLILGLFLSAYMMRNNYPKWGIILDIFIILVLFIFSLYLSASYQTIIDALASANETFLEDYIPRTSLFILNLPIFTVIIGSIMMVLFHSTIPRRTEEIRQSGGYLQGAY
jgi:hypothetical protein